MVSSSGCEVREIKSVVSSAQLNAQLHLLKGQIRLEILAFKLYHHKTVVKLYCTLSTVIVVYNSKAFLGLTGYLKFCIRNIL